MRTFLGASFLLGLACLCPLAGRAQVTNSPVGLWAVDWTGGDRGLTYLTFSNTSNDFVWGGYGISIKSFGPFTIAGTWGFDTKGRVVGGYTLTLPSGSMPGTVTISLPTSEKLTGHAVSEGHHYGLNGEAVGTVPEVNGTWSGQVRTHGTQFFENYTVTASTNMPGWFDLTGSGAGPGGTFTVSGAWIVAADHRANGYTIRDLGESGIVTSSFSGKFNGQLDKATFAGKDGDNKSVVIHATKQ